MVLFYTVLFSLGDPKANLYCQMLVLQYEALVRTKTLKESDEFYVFVDAATHAHLKATAGLPETVKYLVHTSRPLTLLDGMLRRYRFPECLDVSGKLCVHLDLDMLSWRQLNFDTIDIPSDTLVLYPEGRPDDTNYKGLSPLPLGAKAGVTAGFYLYRYGPRVQAIFRDTIRRAHAQKEVCYTIDQPHFNHAIYSSAATNPGVCRFMNPELVSFNGNTHMATAAFLNCCGDPGNGPSHLQKMHGFFRCRFPR